MSTVQIESGIVQISESGDYIIDDSYLEALAASRSQIAGMLANGGGCTPAPLSCSPCGIPIQSKCRVCWAVSLDCETNQLTLSVVNSTPLRPLKFRIHYPEGCGFYDINLVTNTAGMAQRKVSLLSGSGVYWIELKDCSCLVNKHSAEVTIPIPSCGTPCAPCPTAEVGTVDCAPISSSISSTACGQIGSNLCAQAVTMVPTFAYPSIPSGQQIGLTIRVCNNNPLPVEFQLPQVTLPAGLFGTVRVPKTSIGGQACQDFTFILNANGIAGTNITFVLGQGSGLYNCKGAQYSASGGQSTVQVLAGAGSAACGVSIESFAWNPQEIFNGGTAQLCLVLRNNGTSPVTNVNVPAIAGPAGFTGAPIVGSGITIAPGATHQLCTTGVLTHTATSSQTFVATIPAGAITYLCGGATLNVLGASAPIVVRAQSAEVSTCLGTMTLNRQSEVSCDFTLQISNGVPDSVYHIRPRTDVVVSTWFTIPADTVITTDGDGNGESAVFAGGGIGPGSQVLAFRVDGANGCTGNYLHYVSCASAGEGGGLGFDGGEP